MNNKLRGTSKKSKNSVGETVHNSNNPIISKNTKTPRDCLKDSIGNSIKFVYRENDKEDRTISLKNGWSFTENQKTIRGYIDENKPGPQTQKPEPQTQIEFFVEFITEIIEPNCTQKMNNFIIGNKFGGGGKKYKRRKNKSKKQTRKKRKQPKKHRR